MSLSFRHIKGTSGSHTFKSLRYSSLQKIVASKSLIASPGDSATADRYSGNILTERYVMVCSIASRTTYLRVSLQNRCSTRAGPYPEIQSARRYRTPRTRSHSFSDLVCPLTSRPGTTGTRSSLISDLAVLVPQLIQGLHGLEQVPESEWRWHRFGQCQRTD